MTMTMTWYQEATGKTSSNDSLRVCQCLQQSPPTGNEIKDNEEIHKLFGKKLQELLYIENKEKLHSYSLCQI